MSPVLPRGRRVGLAQPRSVPFLSRALGRNAVPGSQRYNVGAAITAITGVNSSDTFTKTSHGLVNGDNVVLSALVGGSALAGLTAGGLFVVAAAANTFQLARVPGGAPVDLGSDVSSVTAQKVVSGAPLPTRRRLGRPLTRVS
jgi:hypothetical protein